MRILPLLITITALLAPTAAHADCTWVVSGRIALQEAELATTLTTRSLEGVQVKVSGSTFAGIYDSWGSVYTSASGSFSVTVSKSCADRFIRVEVKLDNDAFRVINGSGSDWYRVYQSSEKLPPPGINIGTRTFVNGAGTSDLNSPQNYKRALIWYMFNTVVDTLVAEDPWFNFTRKIHVKYPAWVPTGSSYANGIEWTAFIVAGQESMPTVLHELMHLWNFDHNSGTTNWLDAVWGDGTTHGFQEEPNVAFHEGFAEYAARDLLNMIWSRPIPAAYAPIDRTYVIDNGLLTPDMVQRNADDAVIKSLFLLTSSDLWPPSSFLMVCPSEPNLDVFDVLRVFRASPLNGWPTDWQVGDADNGLLLFLQRANDVLTAFDDLDEDLILETIDATSTTFAFQYCN